MSTTPKARPSGKVGFDPSFVRASGSRGGIDTGPLQTPPDEPPPHPFRTPSAPPRRARAPGWA
eukprot:1190755-Prorocentrum_minimum.AAC.4